MVKINKIMGLLRRSVLLLFSIPLFSFCNETSKINIEVTEVNEAQVSEELIPIIEQVKKLSKSGTRADESFLYFTDPHLLLYFDIFDDELKSNLVSFFLLPKEVYDYLSLDFCLCGGDWLNHKDSQAVAKEKLIYADKYMKTLFGNYHKIMGNHDTNYQGVVSNDNTTRGDFPRSFIDGEYFSETGSAYYSFVGEETKFFVLDSGLDWKAAMDEYRWEQVRWLANQLLLDDNDHLAICIHMFYSLGELVPMSKQIVSLCDAFNSRQEISINGQLFDYSESKGTIHFILSGHNHEDVVTYVGRNQSLPSVQTCNFGILKTSPTFDICLIDYTKGLLNMIRVGKGESRQIDLYIN